MDGCIIRDFLDFVPHPENVIEEYKTKVKSALSEWYSVCTLKEETESILSRIRTKPLEWDDLDNILCELCNSIYEGRLEDVTNYDRSSVDNFVDSVESKYYTTNFKLDLMVIELKNVSKFISSAEVCVKHLKKINHPNCKLYENLLSCVNYYLEISGNTYDLMEDTYESIESLYDIISPVTHPESNFWQEDQGD